MQDRSIFSDIDAFSTKILFNGCRQLTFLRELVKKFKGMCVEVVFRKIHIEIFPFYFELGASLAVRFKQALQLGVLNFSMVCFQLLPSLCLCWVDFR